MKNHINDYVILISANTEWKEVISYYPNCQVFTSPYGDWFKVNLVSNQTTIFFQSGWGKIQAAASTQYVVDKWHPKLLINIGTCGGFQGCVEMGTIILVNQTIVYDVIEQMGDQKEAINFFSSDIDLSWLNGNYPINVTVHKMLSADRDIIPGDIPELKIQYQAIAADWESAGIAFVANRNHTKCLILRGVSDIVNETTGEAYDDNFSVFQARTKVIMKTLTQSLPKWISSFKSNIT